ncbi:hypothetical protein OAF65_09235 [Verrucomicrobiales bacterium]|nr:hypothetical protein [Verrucomicrobiales bacterium]
MNSSEPKIILERRYGRNALGCGMVLIIIGFFVCIAIEPSSFEPILGFFGFLFVLVLFSFFSLSADKINIILTVNRMRFREGVWFKRKQMEIPWADIVEVNFIKKTSRSSEGVESESFELHLKEKGFDEVDKPHRIEYCSGFGRQVKYSLKTVHAAGAVQLIQDLIDADSKEARTEIVTKNMGVPEE